jgi:hypothetical protein
VLGMSPYFFFNFKGHDRVLHIDWAYEVGPEVEITLSWIACGIILTDFLYL